MKIITWLHNLNCHKLPPLDRQLSLQQGYINEFEWVDSSKVAARELAIFTMSDKHRGLYQIMPKMTRIREFRIYEVAKHYNITLNDWLSMPREYIAMIIEDLQNELILQKALQDKHEREMKEQERQQAKGQGTPSVPTRWPGA